MRAFDWRMNRAMYWLVFGIIAVLLVALKLSGSQHASISEGVLICLCVPRLHDIGLSGWYVLIGIGVEVIGLAVGFVFFPLDEAMAVAGLTTVVILAMVTWLGCIKGGAEGNDWGDPPAPGLHFKVRR